MYQLFTRNTNEFIEYFCKFRKIQMFFQSLLYKIQLLFYYIVRNPPKIEKNTINQNTDLN